MLYVDPENSEYDVPVLELTQRDLQTLLEKLDDPISERTLMAPDQRISVKSVDNNKPVTFKETVGHIVGQVEISRKGLQVLLENLEYEHVLTDSPATIMVKAVPDEEHYHNCPPEPVYMPSTGKNW